MGWFSNALSNIGSFPKGEKTTKQSSIESPSTSFFGDGNIVTTAKNGTAIQPSTPYWQKKSYTQNQTEPFWSKKTETTPQPSDAYAPPPQPSGGNYAPDPQPMGGKYLVSVQLAPDGQVTSRTYRTGSGMETRENYTLTTNGGNMPTEEDLRVMNGGLPDNVETQSRSASTNLNGSQMVFDFKDNPVLAGVEYGVNAGLTLIETWNWIKSEAAKIGVDVDSMFADFKAEWDKKNGDWYLGKNLGAESPDFKTTMSSDPYSPYATEDWFGKAWGATPPQWVVDKQADYDKAIQDAEDNQTNLASYITNTRLSVKDGNIVNTKTGRVIISLQDYASQMGMSVADVITAFGDRVYYTEPTGGTEGDTVWNETTGTYEKGPKPTDYDPEYYYWDDTTNSWVFDKALWDLDNPKKDPEKDPEKVTKVTIPPTVTFDDIMKEIFGETDMGWQEEQRYFDAVMDNISRAYGIGADELVKRLGDQAEMQGIFNSLDKQRVIADGLQSLYAEMGGQMSEKATEMAYTGLERAEQRRQFNHEMVAQWKNLSQVDRQQAMDFMLGKYNAEVDAMFKQGQLDLSKFNAILSQRLGLSEIELKKEELGYQALALAIDEYLAKANTAAEKQMIVTAGIQALNQMDAYEAELFQQCLMEYAGITSDFFEVGY